MAEPAVVERETETTAEPGADTPAPDNPLAAAKTAEIADATGVSRWHIRRIKSGESVPGYEVARRVSDYLGLASVEELYALQPETERVRRMREGQRSRAGQTAHRRQRSPHNAPVGPEKRAEIRRDRDEMVRLGRVPTVRKLARRHGVSRTTVSNALAEAPDTGGVGEVGRANGEAGESG